ncbi:MAG: MIP/aquaporin family protein [Chloroflexota bacterium]
MHGSADGGARGREESGVATRATSSGLTGPPLRAVVNPPRGGLHFAEWSCELAGTAILLLGGLSAVTLDFGRGSPMPGLVPSGSLRLLLTGALFAATGSLVAISPLGRCSGAHLNPAVTVGFWLTRHVHAHDLAGYLVAQFLGALLGTALLTIIWGPMAASIHDGLTQPRPGLGDAAAVGIEALMTALLLLTIFAFVARAKTMHWTPLAVWAVVTLLVWKGAPLTGTSLNPARSLGPAAVTLTFTSLWVYFVGPVAGAMLAAFLVHLYPHTLRPVTAKLFHDVRYPSVFKTHETAPAASREITADKQVGTAHPLR